MTDGDRVYRITSIGRPLVPAVPTNRAILILMPIAALLYAAIGFHDGAGAADIALNAITGLLVVFGAWALTRELAPDDNPAAFVATLFAFVALIAWRDVSLLLLFTTMFLVRIVNRSTGLAPRVHDSAMVLGLSLWCAWSLSMPLLALVAAAAFLLDAWLPGGRAWQLAFAAAAVAGFGFMLITPDGLTLTITLTLNAMTLALSAIAAAYAFAVAITGPMRSVGDATDTPLHTARVRAGMMIGLLVPLLAPLTATDRSEACPPLIWACLAGVAVSGLVRPLTRRRQRDSADG